MNFEFYVDNDLYSSKEPKPDNNLLKLDWRDLFLIQLPSPDAYLVLM